MKKSKLIDRMQSGGFGVKVTKEEVEKSKNEKSQKKKDK